MKRCTGCGVEKEGSEFPNYKRNKDGLAPRCRVCVKEYHASRYILNRDHILAINKIYRDNNPEKEHARHYTEKSIARRELYNKTNKELIKERRRVTYLREHGYLENRRAINRASGARNRDKRLIEYHKEGSLIRVRSIEGRKDWAKRNPKPRPAYIEPKQPKKT